MIPSDQVAKLQRALPFWLSLALVPVVLFAAKSGGWALILPPLASWGAVLGARRVGRAGDRECRLTDARRAVVLVSADHPDLWFPVQFCVTFGLIWYVDVTDHLNAFEKIALFFGVGILSGTIGINYSHELMHQKNRLERWLGDLLLAMVMYSHFRSEHLLVHHRYVATPRDPVTARYNEGFHQFFPRVLVQCFRSAWRAEKAMLARKGVPVTDASNPFWRYWALQAGFMLLAMLLGGWAGLGLFLYQAFIAVWQLELVNYIEHYGLTRKHLHEGKYEHVQPRHSWNSARKVSNWLLINLQRHSDHHYKPDRRFPCCRTTAKVKRRNCPMVTR